MCEIGDKETNGIISKILKLGTSYVYFRKIYILFCISTKLEEFFVYVYLGVLSQLRLSAHFPVY